MQIQNVPFGTTDWSQVEPTHHAGETGSASWRTRSFGDIRVRMVEYGPGYLADHWCEKGHILFCVAGELETELADGRTFVLKPGMSYQVADGADAHRSRTNGGRRHTLHRRLRREMNDLTQLSDHVAAGLGEAVTGRAISYGELTIVVDGARINEVLTYLRDDAACRFISFIDLCGADYPGREKRFDVVYHLLSPRHNARIRIKVETDEVTPVPSCIPVFPAANWFEREAYDLYGILFSGHPDLRRILTDYGFDGHPLRKDFPMTGFVELRYDDEQKRVVYERVKLQQEFRNFDFLSPWEGTDYVLPGDEKAKAS